MGVRVIVRHRQRCPMQRIPQNSSPCIPRGRGEASKPTEAKMSSSVECGAAEMLHPIEASAHPQARAALPPLCCVSPPSSTAVGRAEGCRDTDGVVSLQVPVATPTTTTAAVGVTVDGETEGVVCVPITKLSLCPTVAETGTIAGIASGLAMALIGAVSSYISYQQKKFCFSIQRKFLPQAPQGTEQALP